MGIKTNAIRDNIVNNRVSSWASLKIFCGCQDLFIILIISNIFLQKGMKVHILQRLKRERRVKECIRSIDCVCASQ